MLVLTSRFKYLYKCHTCFSFSGDTAMGGEDQSSSCLYRAGAAGGNQEALPWGNGQGEGPGAQEAGQEGPEADLEPDQEK